jgi:hypothetical protein
MRKLVLVIGLSAATFFANAQTKKMSELRFVGLKDYKIK